MKISDHHLLGPAFSNNGKENITVLNLLIHDSGFPPGPYPLYSSRDFGCVESHKPRPRLSFSCTTRIYQSLLKQKTVRPIGEETVYSDLSMITLSFVLGKLTMEYKLVELQDLKPDCISEFPNSEPGIYMCYYEAFIKKYVLDFLNMNNTFYLPEEKSWGLIAPAWNETDGLRGEVVQGEVSDENTFALGGISGHAGLFSNSLDLYKLSSKLLMTTEDLFNKTTVQLFTKIHNKQKSSRALGWDTNNFEFNTHKGCGNLSESTFTHTGYTGTQICIDPERDLVAILLTNRVYPIKTNNADGVKYLRREFSNTVKRIVDTYYPPNNID